MAKRNGLPKSVQPGTPKLPIKTPSGWDRMPLHESLKEIRRPANLKPDAHYRLVTVKRSRQGVEERGWLLGRDIKTKTQFYVSSGDFLISKRQIVHGACGLIPLELDGSVVSNEYAIVRSKGRIDLTFLRYLSESVYFQQTCFHSSIGVHIEKMIFKLDQWLKWEFDLPPLWEQHKITRILSTWDKAIEIVEKLIENSKAQKKALMQQLLTGEQGKEEPSSPWRRVRLGDIAIINPARVTQIAGPTDQSDIALNDQVTFLAMEDVSEAAEILQRQTRTYTEVSKGFPSIILPTHMNSVLVVKPTCKDQRGKGGYQRISLGVLAFLSHLSSNKKG
jgi:type I restriction enzyme S subunit